MTANNHRLPYLSAVQIQQRARAWSVFVTLRTVYSWMKSGKLPATRTVSHGLRSWRYVASADVEAFLATLPGALKPAEG